LRVKNAAKKNHINVVVAQGNNINVKKHPKISFSCNYKAPGPDPKLPSAKEIVDTVGFGRAFIKGKCTFNLRYKMNESTKLWSLVDYDDLHIHPCNKHMAEIREQCGLNYYTRIPVRN
jgi:hypothetical protein